MSSKDQLLSTRILDYHGKIGPFFFKEFFVVFLGCASLFFLVMLLSLFVHIKGVLLLLIPGAFLLIVSVVRFVLVKRVTSPWYLHKWIAQRFFKPKHILANVWRDTLESARPNLNDNL